MSSNKRKRAGLKRLFLLTLTSVATLQCTCLIAPQSAAAQKIEVIPPEKPYVPPEKEKGEVKTGDSLVMQPVNIKHLSLLQLLCDATAHDGAIVSFRAHARVAGEILKLFPTEEISRANLDFDSIESLPVDRSKITLLGIDSIAECDGKRVRVTGKLQHPPGTQATDTRIDLIQLSEF